MSKNNRILSTELIILKNNKQNLVKSQSTKTIHHTVKEWFGVLQGVSPWTFTNQPTGVLQGVSPWISANQTTVLTAQIRLRQNYHHL